MKVEAAALRQVSLPLRSAFVTSSGPMTERTCIIVEVWGEGLIGLGECVAFDGQWYSYETTGTAWEVMSEYLIPRLLGADITGPEIVWDLFAQVQGHNMAKAALEMACWDLVARARGVSLSSLLGGTRTRVEVGVSIGLQESPAALVELAGCYLAEGYRRIKLKIAPGQDTRNAQVVRAAFPTAPMQVDANSAYSLEDIDVFRELDDLGLLLIEQPLGADDLLEHRDLQRRLKTPICLDESILGPEDARNALDLGSCRIINLKPGRVGGHLRSLAIHELCIAHGAPLWCGGMLETNVGRAHNLALASLPGFLLPGDISASDRYYERDIATPSFALNSDSTIDVPTGPGIGVDLAPELVWDREQEFIAG